MRWKWFLVFSIGLNLVLLIALQLERGTETGAGEPTSLPASQIAVERPPSYVLPNPQEEAKIARKKKANPALQLLETDDYPTFIKRLRQAGMSEETIATLVVAEIRDQAVDDQIGLTRRLNRGELTQEEFQKQIHELRKQQETILETLLGKQGYRQYQIEHDHQMRQLAQTGKFSSETLGQLYDLRKKQQDQARELTEKLQSQSLSQWDYQDQTVALQKEYRKQLEEMFGPDVARQIRIETDWHVQNLQRQMRAVEISDSELYSLAQVLEDVSERQQALHSLRQRGEASWEDLRPQYDALDQEKKDGIWNLLGPQRYAEYIKQTDSVYQQMKPWGRENGLSDAHLDYIYQLVKSWRAQQDDLQRQLRAKEIKNEDYRAAFEEISSATKRTLQAYLGADRYERLKRATGQVP